MPEDWQHGGFGLYIHWPYCEAKCPYCDFNSHVARFIDHNRWRAAYLAELRRVRDETGPRVLKSIFFGGGTPSLMQPDTVAAVIGAATTHWTPANDIEISLEANPGSVERQKFRAFGEAGVNRVSMGIQALNDPDLRRLGRIHSRADALAAFDIARETFDRISFDLIYARQDQTVGQWSDELGEALSLAVDHLSLYQLTIEPGTAFGDRFARGGLKGLPDDDLGADLFEVTQDLCRNAGMPAYEVSNHARPDAASRHNLIYWQSGDYAGIGPGAHGRLTLDGTRYATECALNPNQWLDQAEGGNGYALKTPVSQDQRVEEFLIMGLRLYSGVQINRLQAISGKTLDPRPLAALQDQKLVTSTDGVLRASPQGMPVLNHILRELVLR